MKMKNVFMLLLGAMLVLSMAGGVSAATANAATSNITQADLNGDNPATKETTVSLNLAQSFEVEYPANFELTPMEDNSGNTVYTGLAFVNATVKRLDYGKKLTVTVNGNPSGDSTVWKLTAGTESLDYIIRVGDAGDVDLDTSGNLLSHGGSIISDLGVGNTASKALHFKLQSSVETVTSGTYTDILTFTVAVA